MVQLKFYYHNHIVDGLDSIQTQDESRKHCTLRSKRGFSYSVQHIISYSGVVAHLLRPFSTKISCLVRISSRPGDTPDATMINLARQVVSIIDGQQRPDVICIDRPTALQVCPDHGQGARGKKKGERWGCSRLRPNGEAAGQPPNVGVTMREDMVVFSVPLLTKCRLCSETRTRTRSPYTTQLSVGCCPYTTGTLLCIVGQVGVRWASALK